MLPEHQGFRRALVFAFLGILVCASAARADDRYVTAASHPLTVWRPAPIDFTGDGESDFAIVRNTGGAVTWWIADAASTASSMQVFGLNTDRFIPADYDGDGKTDIAIWRSGPAGVAGFWILRSSDGVVTFTPFGQTGDDPSVVGDYDGDGKADFAIQRNAGGNHAMFWINQSTAGITQVLWGTPTDVIVPGDYDGDGKTDIAIIRGVGASIQWWIRRSSDLGVTSMTFGLSATDFSCQADYDGDGKTDIAIWRPSATPGQTAFWVNKSSGGVLIRQWGLLGDYPVAAYNSH